MIQRVREVLLTKYIGSILIALLCSQALAVLIESVIRTLFWVVYQQRTHSEFSTSPPTYSWNQLIFSAVNISLNVLTAYGIAQWLYPSEQQPSLSSEDNEVQDADQQ